MRITHVAGLPFTPRTMDLAEYSPVFPNEVISFIGTKPDGAVVTAGFALDGVMDGPGGAADFQTFVFPPDFADIVLLQVPNATWRFDNFRFTTIIPPPLPSDQWVGPAFSSAAWLYSKPVTEDTLVIGEDFEFVSGFQPASPTKTKFLSPVGSATLSTLEPHYDRAAETLYFGKPGGNGIWKAVAGPASAVVTLQNMADAGFPAVEALSRPRSAGGRLLFLGAEHDANSYSLFRLQGGAITALVTPTTLLPDAKSGSTPHYMPRDLAVSAADFAFDTTVASSTHTWRLYASFGGGPIVQVLHDKQTIPWDGETLTVNNFSSFGFTPQGDLRVRTRLTTGNAWLHFTGASLTRVQRVDQWIQPENEGTNVFGELVESTEGVTFLQSADSVYRSHQGRYFRVAGAGDVVGGEIAWSVELKAVRQGHPLRVVVEVRHESAPATAHLFELLPSDPRTAAPRFGGPIVHPESGHLFIPLSHLTLGRSYHLQRSDNLRVWTDMRPIERVEPLQHVVISPSELASPSFFRVGER